jgi:hypothetical protein
MNKQRKNMEERIERNKKRLIKDEKFIKKG